MLKPGYRLVIIKIIIDLVVIPKKSENGTGWIETEVDYWVCNESKYEYGCEEYKESQGNLGGCYGLLAEFLRNLDVRMDVQTLVITLAQPRRESLYLKPQVGQ